MNENEEIIELLKAINRHLETLDESMLAMKKRIDHIDDRIIREDEDNENMAWELAMQEHEAEQEKPRRSQLEEISAKLDRVNSNIVTVDNNQRVRHDKLRDMLDGFMDQVQSQFSAQTRQYSQIISMLKNIHIWNG